MQVPEPKASIFVRARCAADGGSDVACYHPIPAWQLESGDVVFSERGAVVRRLDLPCGQCFGCRLERSRQWAMRCVHEASLHTENCFITLTYRPDSLPPRESLVYSDFQLFMKRFRKKVYPIRPRFYMAGEYRDDMTGPHFHACIFGFNFPSKPWKKTDSGEMIGRSDLLEELWPHGFSSVSR